MARHGENIRKRKDGRWEGRYTATDKLTGRTRSHSVYARTYEEVREKLASAKKSTFIATDTIEAGNKKNTFHEAAAEWLETVGKQRKHSTYIKYRTIYSCYIRETLGVIALTALTQKDVNELAAAVDEASSSIHKSVKNVTNQILRFASVKYGIPAYTFVCLVSKQASRPVETLTKTEQTKLVKCLCKEPDIYKTGVLLCMSTGLRIGEICALKWSDIDFENKLLYVSRTVQRIAVMGRKTRTALLESEPKSSFSKREIPIADEIVKFLLPYRKSEGYLFKGTKPMEPRTYQNKFAKYIRDAELPKSHFHILRHTFATNCIDSGMDVKSLSEILGHADVKITLNRYVHPTMETKRNHMNTLAVIYFSIVGQSADQAAV